MLLSKTNFEALFENMVIDQSAKKDHANEKASLLLKGKTRYFGSVGVERGFWVLFVLILGSLSVYIYRSNGVTDQRPSCYPGMQNAQLIPLTRREPSSGIEKASDAVEISRAARFASVAREFQHKHDGSGRTIPRRVSEISLDFEIEIGGSRLDMTPSLVLERGGFSTLVGREHNSSGIFPTVSKWFSIGLDGVWPRSTDAMLELQTVTAHPVKMLEGSLIPDLHAWLATLTNCSIGNTCVLGSGALGEIRYKHTGHFTADVQYTVGLPLSRVPKLLGLTAHVNPGIRNDMLRTEAVCRTKKFACSDSYRGLLLLAARLLTIASSVKECTNPPKRYMQPWLVRTHFGDMATLGGSRRYELDGLVNDALFVAQLEPNASLWLAGVRDYLRFPEMAEISGLVRARGERIPYRRGDAAPPELANNLADLKEQAAVMMNVSTCVNHHYTRRPCLPTGELTAERWLREVALGRDLMSDWDSPVSAQHARSHLLWKSMGQWRMRPGDDRVYLECYKKGIPCIPMNGTMSLKWTEAAALGHGMRSVARTVSQLL